jgi:ABC-type uncharacterized transport system substrate-binding protein
MNRRAFVSGALSLLAAPLIATAQQARKIWRVGDLSTSPPEVASAATWASFVQGLRESRYVEGETVAFERRSARGEPNRLPGLASDLVRRNVDVIFARGPWAARAAKEATTTTPIVVVDLESDPVAEGFVKSLGRPGGNVTGLFLDLADLCGKQLEFLKELVPGLRRVGVLGDAVVNASQFRATDTASGALATEIERLSIRNSKDLDGVFRVAASTHAQALLVLTSPITIGRRTALADLAAKYHLPAMYGYREHVDVGGLISYGPDLPNMFRRCGEYVARVLSGAKPEELPVERPAKFELVINLKTAKALGLTIPQSLLIRADQLIE